MSEIKVFKDVPICSFLIVSMTIVFSLYATTLIKQVPCGKNVMSSFLSNFVHMDFYHLTSNLIALYSLSRLEREVGPSLFLQLIVFLLVVNTVLEVSFHKIFPTTKCSIGFSGILFGLITWDLITTKDLDIYLLISIFTMVVVPSLKRSNVSLSSHCIGAISGIIGGIITSIMYPDQRSSLL